MVAVEVGVVHLPLFEVRLLNLVGRPVGLLHAGAVDQVLELAAVERGALARLAEIELGDDPRGAVDLDLQPFFQIGCAEHVLLTP